MPAKLLFLVLPMSYFPRISVLGEAVQWMAPVLAMGVAGVMPLETAVERTSATMATGCTVNARRKRPAAYQLVANPQFIRSLG